VSESYPDFHGLDRGWDYVLCEVRAGAEETVFVIETAYYVRGSVRDEVKS